MQTALSSRPECAARSEEIRVSSRPNQRWVSYVSLLRHGFWRSPQNRVPHPCIAPTLKSGTAQNPRPLVFSLIPSPYSLSPAWYRLAQGVVLAAAIVLTTAAADPTARFDKLGHQIMCSCGCNEILLECNHVGCPLSDGMRHELMAGLDKGDNDSLIFQAFVQKYGPTVLAAPTAQGFNIVAWVMPFAVLILGIGGTALLIRKWQLRTVPMPPPSTTPRFSDIRERIRRETEL